MVSAEPEIAADATSQSPDANAPQPNIEPPDVTSIGGALADFLKWIFYGVVIAAALWWSWRNREFLLGARRPCSAMCDGARLVGLATPSLP